MTGPVPAGLPAPTWPWFDAATYRGLLGRGCRHRADQLHRGRTNRQELCPAQPLRDRREPGADGAGCGQSAVGLGQGFPVTGANSRTAVNDAMGGKSQLVGIVAAGAMLLVLFLFTGPLALVPTTALAAVILVSAAGPVRHHGTAAVARHEQARGAVVGRDDAGRACPGRPRGRHSCRGAVLVLAAGDRHAPEGRGARPLAGLQGYQSIADHPEAETVPGLLLYRFSGNLVFFNIDYFCERVRAAIRRAATPVVWVIVDLSPVSFVDATAVQRFDELREELTAQGVTLALARVKSSSAVFSGALAGAAPFGHGGAQVSEPAIGGAGIRGSIGRRRHQPRRCPGHLPAQRQWTSSRGPKLASHATSCRCSSFGACPALQPASRLERDPT